MWFYVSDPAAVDALAAAAVDRFGAVHVVCNNAGVATDADPWFGPLSAWSWVLGVNLWGVIHGIRAFLPLLARQREGHIVNTASAAGLIPATQPAYDAAKHAVVAVSEDLYRAVKVAGLPVGVRVVCPGWIRTRIYQAKRNWPQSLGEVPPPAATAGATAPHVQRAIDEGMAPAAVADLVADAIAADRFWIFTDPQFTHLASTGGSVSPKATIPRSGPTCRTPARQADRRGDPAVAGGPQPRVMAKASPSTCRYQVGQAPVNLIQASRHDPTLMTARLAHVSVPLKRQLWERRSAKVQQPHCLRQQQTAATASPSGVRDRPTSAL
jgi:NAD(P)-dependent dehydrogenase (short-subunit alcohol dehydrogenase family)